MTNNEQPSYTPVGENGKGQEGGREMEIPHTKKTEINKRTFE